MTSRIRLLLVASSLVFAVLAAPAAAAPGELDSSFGSGGTVRLLPSEEDIALRAVAVQPDLKIVIVGSEAPGNAILVRLLPNGQLDPSFGSAGKVTTTLPTGFSEAQAVALQPDGKIVVAGGAKGAVNVDFFFARYNADGSPDASFGGGDGVELVPVGGGDDEAEAVAIGPDGRIAATGSADLPVSNEALAAIVLGTGGTPDPSFGGDGSVMKETAAKFDTGVAVAMFDGGLLLADSSAAGGGDGFVLMKLLSNGEYDPGFGGGDGVVETPIPELGAGRITDFALRPDGRIVASGYGLEEVGPPPTFQTKIAAVGYLANGELDASFAGTGIFTHKLNQGGDSAQTIELTPNGKILLVGNYDPEPSNSSTALLRLDPLGGLDPTFGSGGAVLRGIQAPFGESFEDAALDAEERLVVVSTAYIGNNNTEIVVTRYLGDKVPLPPRPAQPIAVPVVNQPPHAWMKAVPKKVPPEKLKGFSGSASDPDGDGVEQVQIALVKRIKVGRLTGPPKTSPARIRCFALKNAKARFKRAKPKGKQCPQRWLNVKGKNKWSFKLNGVLPPGRYVVYARATDGKGEVETSFSRKLGNRYAFRVLPSG